MDRPLNKYFDHTLLKPEATKDQIRALCEEAKKYDFYSVCVNGCYVSYAKDLLKDTDVRVAAVVGFPLGAMSSAAKQFETEDAIKNGASEIDMVINVGFLKSGDYDAVRDDIKGLAEICHKNGAILKVIIETCLLTDEEKIKVCQLSAQADADFVKTSTGFSTGGATCEDVKLMKANIPDTMEVKASGGIRDYDTTISMIKAGATRIGASAGATIMDNMEK